MQPSLFHIEVTKDEVFTPDWLAKDMVEYFLPASFRRKPMTCLDPCAGDGVFYKYLPVGSLWCEIKNKRDFYALHVKVDWIISNPPYSHLLSWIRHSFTVSKNIVYLVPIHRIWNSNEFLDDLYKWGGIAHIRRYGTGTDCGFPFGHAVAAIHFQKDYDGPIHRSKYSGGG